MFNVCYRGVLARANAQLNLNKSLSTDQGLEVFLYRCNVIVKGRPPKNPPVTLG